jgi:hypothetical protein
MAFNKDIGTLLQQDSKAFDFSLSFEQLFFTILPSSLFLVASSWRILCLARRPPIVQALTWQYVKLVSSTDWHPWSLLMSLVERYSDTCVSRNRPPGSCRRRPCARIQHTHGGGRPQTSSSDCYDTTECSRAQQKPAPLDSTDLVSVFDAHVGCSADKNTVPICE